MGLLDNFMKAREVQPVQVQPVQTAPKATRTRRTPEEKLGIAEDLYLHRMSRKDIQDKYGMTVGQVNGIAKDAKDGKIPGVVWVGHGQYEFHGNTGRHIVQEPTAVEQAQIAPRPQPTPAYGAIQRPVDRLNKQGVYYPAKGNAEGDSPLCLRWMRQNTRG